MAPPKKLTDEQENEIRQLRKTQKLTYQELANMYGVNARTINRICDPKFNETSRQLVRQYNANFRRENKEVMAELAKRRRRYVVSFDKELEKDIVDRLDSVPSYTDYIRQLIHQDIIQNPELEK